MGHFTSTMKRIEEEEAAGKPESQMAEVAGRAPVVAWQDIPKNQNVVDVPTVGEPIRFYLRKGEFRGGRNVFAAQVTKVNENGTIDLMAFLDVDDFIGQRNIKSHEADPDGMGWERVIVGSDLLNRLADDVYGDFLSEGGANCILRQLHDLGVRLDKLESAKLVTKQPIKVHK